eukprot:9296437-Pyramimonas_sp.AAC.1
MSTTAQALPFGGVKDSGFDRFAGIEGLRGCCYPKAVCEDRLPWLMKTNIPPLLQYPVSDVAFDFVSALCKLFYGFGAPPPGPAIQQTNSTNDHNRILSRVIRWLNEVLTVVSTV